MSSSKVKQSLITSVSDGSWSGPMDLKRRNIIEKIVLLCAVAIVLGSFTVPIVVHIDYKVKHSGASKLVPPNISDINCTGNELFSETFNGSTDNSFVSSCGKDFFQNNDTCLLSCHKFNQNKPPWDTAIEVIVYWTGWFGFITAILVLIISIAKYKTIFTFPSVLLVYMDLAYCIVEVFVIITTVDKSNGLYCKHKEFYQSISDPTTFCTVSGMIFHYCIVNATIWWFFHVSVLFYKLIFPFKAKKIEKYEKYIHVLFVCLGLLLPLPAVIYSKLKLQYVTVVFPPILCLPNNSDLFYYSTVLVINVLTALGISMFIPMFYVVHKHQGIFRSRTNGGMALSSAEIKLLFALCYYAVFGIVTILYFQPMLEHQGDIFMDIASYYKNNSCPNNSTSAAYSTFDSKYSYDIRRAVGYVIMSLIPTALLVFLINWKNVGHFFLSIRKRMFRSETVVVSNRNSVHSALSPIPESSNTYKSI